MAGYRLLLVDDHALIREGIKTLLDGVRGVQVVGEAENGHEALTVCREVNPDLILMDLNMPLLDGVSAINLIRARWPHIRILALTSNVSEANAALALDAGAHGYLLKRSRREVLLAAVERVGAGQAFIDPSIDAAQVASLRADGESSAGVTLTERERQLLKLIAGGSRNRDIAELLNISLKTVETHRLNLMKKLDAHNAADLTQWAFRLGLLGND